MDNVGAIVDNRIFCHVHMPGNGDGTLIYADSEWQHLIHCCICGNALPVVLARGE